MAEIYDLLSGVSYQCDTADLACNGVGLCSCRLLYFRVTNYYIKHSQRLKFTSPIIFRRKLIPDKLELIGSI